MKKFLYLIFLVCFFFVAKETPLAEEGYYVTKGMQYSKFSDAINAMGTSGEIEIVGNINLSNTTDAFNINREIEEITLTGTGTITRSGDFCDYTLINIYTSGKVNITGSLTFDNNCEENKGNMIINNRESDLYVSGATFQNNIPPANRNGAAIYTLKNLTVENCTFKNSYSPNGASIYASTSNQIDLKVSNSTFENNYARTFGGAIYVSGRNINVDINNSTFKNNKSNTNEGGAIYINQTGGTVKIEKNKFIENSAYYYGGALVFNELNSVGQIIDNEFYDNKVEVFGGGTIEIYGCDAIIKGGKISGGIALEGGGAIYTQAGSVNIDGMTFENNKSTWEIANGDRADSYGGALYALGADYILSNCTFNNNSAINGGAIALADYADILTIDNCTFKNNTATLGGAIYTAVSANYNYNNEVTINSGTFNFNTAKKGGALYITDYLSRYNATERTGEGINEVTINGGEFSSNSASDGDDIYINTAIAGTDADGNILLGENRNKVYINGGTFKSDLLVDGIYQNDYLELKNNVEDAIYLPTNKIINIPNNLNGKINVYVEDLSVGAKIIKSSSENAEVIASKINILNGNYYGVVDGENIILQIKETINDEESEEEIVEDNIKDDETNPTTSDNIIIYIILSLLAIIGIAIGNIKLKFIKK